MMQEQNGKTIDEKFENLEVSLLKRQNYSCENQKSLKLEVSRFKSEFKQKWTKAKRTKDVFLKQNIEWLQGSLKLSALFEELSLECIPPTIGTGRPKIAFDLLSDRSKRRNTEELRQNYSLGELGFATQMKLREEKHPQAANLLQVILKSPECAADYIKAYQDMLQKEKEKMSPLDALALLVEGGNCFI